MQKSTKYYFIDVPRLKSGKKDCISMCYSHSVDIEERYEEVRINRDLTIRYNDGRVDLIKRKVGSPQIIMEYIGE